MIQVTGYRILVQPDPPPSKTASGLHIPDNFNDSPPMSGTVIGLGHGSEERHRIKVKAVADCMGIVREYDHMFNHLVVTQLALDELNRYLEQQTLSEHVVKVGDRVIFSPASAVDVVIGEDERYVVLEEDDILAVYEKDEEAA